MSTEAMTASWCGNRFLRDQSRTLVGLVMTQGAVTNPGLEDTLVVQRVIRQDETC